MTTEVLRALFARSGNRCAYPGCDAQLINAKNQFIAQICHIEAAATGGARFNDRQSDEERRHYDNLLILCYPHHVETDDIREFTVERLKSIKTMHERGFATQEFRVDENVLFAISAEMDRYWSSIAVQHASHVIPHLAIPINVRATYTQLADDCVALLGRIVEIRDMLIRSERTLYADLIELLKSLEVPDSSLHRHREQVLPFQSRNLVLINLGLTNAVTPIRVALIQMELQYLEEHLKVTANDQQARERMQLKKLEFERFAKSAGYSD